MLTARDEDIDKVVGLEVGADDYLTKPFNARELVARIKSILRRANAPVNASKKLVCGEIHVDAVRRECLVGGEQVMLAPKEFDLLWELLERDGEVLNREQLLEKVWGYTYAGDTTRSRSHAVRFDGPSSGHRSIMDARCTQRRHASTSARMTLVAACLLAFAGCSGGGDETGKQSKSTDEATAAAADEPDRGWEQLLPPADECPQQDDADAQPSKLRDAAICVINHVRQERGLDALPPSRALLDTARSKVADIMRCEEFSHTACGRELGYWFDAVGYLDGCRSGAYAENLGIGERRLGSPRRVVLGWLESKGHRENLLSRRWSEQAIAVERRASWEASAGAGAGARAPTRTYEDVNVWVSHFGVANGC